MARLKTVVSLGARNCNLCLFVLKSTDYERAFYGYKCITKLWLRFENQNDVRYRILKIVHSSFIKSVGATILSLLKTWGVVKLVGFGFCLLFLLGSWFFQFSLELTRMRRCENPDSSCFVCAVYFVDFRIKCVSGWNFFLYDNLLFQIKESIKLC